MARHDCPFEPRRCVLRSKNALLLKGCRLVDKSELPATSRDIDLRALSSKGRLSAEAEIGILRDRAHLDFVGGPQQVGRLCQFRL